MENFSFYQKILQAKFQTDRETFLDQVPVLCQSNFSDWALFVENFFFRQMARVTFVRDRLHVSLNSDSKGSPQKKLFSIQMGPS